MMNIWNTVIQILKYSRSLKTLCVAFHNTLALITFYKPKEKYQNWEMKHGSEVETRAVHQSNLHNGVTILKQ